MYSFGRLCLELYTNSPPFFPYDQFETSFAKIDPKQINSKSPAPPQITTFADRLREGLTPHRPIFHGKPEMKMSQNIWDLLLSCWEWDRRKRPTSRDVVNFLNTAPLPELCDPSIVTRLLETGPKEPVSVVSSAETLSPSQ